MSGKLNYLIKLNEKSMVFDVLHRTFNAKKRRRFDFCKNIKRISFNPFQEKENIPFIFKFFLFFKGLSVRARTRGQGLMALCCDSRLLMTQNCFQFIDQKFFFHDKCFFLAFVFLFLRWNRFFLFLRLGFRM